MTARHRAFANDQGKRLNDRSVGVLRDGQDDAGVLPRRSLVLATVMIMVALMLATAIALSLNLESSGKLLEKMMHAVRCGRGDKKPKRSSEAQV